MQLEKLGDLRAHVAGGTDREGGGDGPVVVLMHGFGAPGTDLVGLWRVLQVPREVRFVFPEAPLSLADEGEFMSGYGDARAWWRIDMQTLQSALLAGRLDDLARRVPVGLDQARASVCRMLDGVEEALGVQGSQIVLGGFSQGAMLSVDVALRAGRKLGGLALMSGSLVAEADWLPRLGELAGMAVFMSHGERDPLLPFALAERLRDEMTRAGLDVTFVRFPGGHEIPARVLDGLGAYLTRTCAAIA